MSSNRPEDYGPPAMGTTHGLPFHLLSPRDFERLCLGLVRREGFAEAEFFGAPGTDQGCDIVAWKEGRRFAFLVKRVQAFSGRDAETEIEKILRLPEETRPSELVFIVSCDLSVAGRTQAVKAWGDASTCHFWSGTDLDQKVKRHPKVVREFFQLPLEVPPPPEGFFNVPPRNAFFTGRERALEMIRAALLSKGAAALGQMAVISGLGGIGKTQTAVEYACRHRDDYQAVFFVRAETTAETSSGFAEIARGVGIEAVQDQAAVVEAVHEWLTENSDWLLIFDNADSPADVAPFVPRDAFRGHVLLTSRAKVFDVLGIARPLLLGELPRDEALAFLLKRAGREDAGDEERTAAAVLAGELGYLPLALEQAGAYLLQDGARIADYLESYRKHGLEILDRGRPVAGGYRDSVAVTLEASFAAVEAASPAAADLLRASAILGPDDIPEKILTAGGPHLGPALAKAMAKGDPLAVDDLLVPLLRYSLIARNVEKRTWSIHPLVQKIVRAELGSERWKWEERAAKAEERASFSVEAELPESSLPRWLGEELEESRDPSPRRRILIRNPFFTHLENG